MTVEQIKCKIINDLHKDYTFWYRILGEMYEATFGFKQYGIMQIRIDKKRYKIEWFRYDWRMVEVSYKL